MGISTSVLIEIYQCRVSLFFDAKKGKKENNYVDYQRMSTNLESASVLPALILMRGPSPDFGAFWQTFKNAAAFESV